MNMQGDINAKLGAHIMRALSMALAEHGMNKTQADSKASLPAGTMGKWLKGERTPDVGRFVETCLNLDVDPVAVVEKGIDLASRAGDLEHVDVIPFPAMRPLAAHRRNYDEHAH